MTTNKAILMKLNNEAPTGLEIAKDLFCLAFLTVITIFLGAAL